MAFVNRRAHRIRVIAIDNHDATTHILHSLREQFPSLPVIIRSKDNKDLSQLYQYGANHVVAETRESSLRIAEILISKISTAPNHAKDLIHSLRNEH